MALTPEQLAELERLGPETIRLKLMLGGPGRGASIPGFETGPFQSLTRSDVETWLAEKSIQEAAMQRSTLTWAKIAGIAGIICVIVTAIVGVVGIAVTIWLAK
jgi:hypothetical protein